MTVLPILTVPNPILKRPSLPIARVDDEIRTLMRDMLETMYAAPGIGLAAVQVGVLKRVIVMDLAKEDEPRQPRFFANPEILESSGDLSSYEEGCLSVPEIFEDIERPTKVKLRYLNYDGDEVVEVAEGLFAVCIQHEMDHLEGIVFIDYLSRLKRARAVDRVKKTVQEKAKSAPRLAKPVDMRLNAEKIGAG